MITFRLLNASSNPSVYFCHFLKEFESPLNAACAINVLSNLALGGYHLQASVSLISYSNHLALFQQILTLLRISCCMSIIFLANISKAGSSLSSAMSTNGRIDQMNKYQATLLKWRCWLQGQASGHTQRLV